MSGSGDGFGGDLVVIRIAVKAETIPLYEVAKGKHV